MGNDLQQKMPMNNGIPILDDYGKLAARILAEPQHRLSQSQRDSLIQIGKADPSAHVLGLDQKYHPVVKARMPGPRGPVRYALDKAGNSTKERGPLVERW